jgi:hypothetical protein
VRLPVMFLVLLSACSARDNATSGPPAACPAQSLGLSVTPEVIARGADVTLAIDWTIDGEVEPPVGATLRVGDAGSVEVDLVLDVVDFNSPQSFGARQQNPFGLGTPAGFVSVLARAAGAVGCEEPVSDVTTFVLE